MLLILGVTSLGFVKKHMHARMWKRVQVMAYPFFLLTYVHLMLMLAPSAMIGSTASIVGILVYSVVFAAYLALRDNKRPRDVDGKEVRKVMIAEGVKLDQPCDGYWAEQRELKGEIALTRGDFAAIIPE